MLKPILRQRARCYGPAVATEPNPYPRREGVVPMRILCADSAVATMNDQLRLLIGANASTELYRLAPGRPNEGSSTCPFALNLPIAIRTLRNELIPAFHNHPAVGADGLARVAAGLQVVGIGPGSAGARHARPAVRVDRDDQALRARGTRRPAQQNAQAGPCTGFPSARAQGQDQS